MTVDPVPVAVRAAQSEDVLDLIEQPLTDERFVATGVDLPLPDDISCVVRVVQHRVELGGGHRLLDGMTSCRAAHEPEVGHRHLDFLDGVIAGRVELPGLDDQLRSFFVDGLPARRHRGHAHSRAIDRNQPQPRNRGGSISESNGLHMRTGRTVESQDWIPSLITALHASHRHTLHLSSSAA
ncbi:hypothetical protein OG326_34375 [Nocardia sp. NBC_01327]|nr:hypothetical protein OG326_34375 [Nocardia sp. NBC_01327]